MRFGHHAAWITLGIIAVLGMWFAYSIPGAIALFGSIGGAFVLWRFIGPRGSWTALVVIGVTMASLLGWQAVTGARCPAPGERIIIRDGKPPVSCDELRASAASMATLFAVIGLIGIAAPFYLRTGGGRATEAADGDVTPA